MATATLLVDRLQSLVRLLKDLAREHNALPEEMTKTIRHELYKREGNYAKALTPLFLDYEILEQDILLKAEQKKAMAAAAELAKEDRSPKTKPKRAKAKAKA